MTHHPTFEQYMTLWKSSHLSHDQLAKRWKGGVLREALGDGPDEVRRLLDVTIQDIERGGFSKYPLGRIVGPRGPEHCGRMCQTTPCDVCPARIIVAPMRHKPEREPKGPLGLRLELWWMRVRLWWMVGRLDGAREALREAFTSGL